jgi:hypothetical protein
MNKTHTRNVTENTIAVDIDGLMQILGCGRETARTIAKLAQAQIETNSRRALFSVEKIREYCETHSF